MKTKINNKKTANDKFFAKAHLLQVLLLIALFLMVLVWYVMWQSSPKSILIHVVFGLLFIAMVIYYLHLDRVIFSLYKAKAQEKIAENNSLIAEFMESVTKGTEPAFMTRHKTKILEIQNKISQGIIDADVLATVHEFYNEFEPLDQDFIKKLIEITHQGMSPLIDLSVKILITYEAKHSKSPIV